MLGNCSRLHGMSKHMREENTCDRETFKLLMVIASGSILYTTHHVCLVHWLEKYNLRKTKVTRGKNTCYFTTSNLNYCSLYMQLSVSLLKLN